MKELLPVDGTKAIWAAQEIIDTARSPKLNAALRHIAMAFDPSVSEMEKATHHNALNLLFRDTCHLSLDEKLAAMVIAKYKVEVEESLLLKNLAPKLFKPK